MTVLFSNECDAVFPFSPEEQADRVIRFVIDHIKFPYEAEVSVTLVNKEQIHQTNLEFRQVDRPTDVLSFPMMEYDKPGDFEGSRFMDTLTVSPETGEVLLGDIVLCEEVLKAQAEEYGHSVLREYSFLIMHSMLHLFGFDHMEEDERLQMEDLQKEIMNQMNITR